MGLVQYDVLHVNFLCFGLKYPAWQSCGTFVVDSEMQIDPDSRMCLPAEERYVLYDSSWRKKGGKGMFLPPKC